ncbi:MAG: 3-deoxy-manno-octulosonate cytidylyltransferase [Candidatus Adiutrix sp.]|jgi:3-deoxy-manno-octulosonate cytidylyltransferase (CMP-KDO synthetase)|nr:3-deoxy-manno-octulosonate cytidylyltransferase [Candidatus Adiutrix sp.]
MKLAALIAARWASASFPGKALTPLWGRPMIEHVYRRSQAIAGLDQALVVTDSPEIERAVRGFGGRVIGTGPQNVSDTDHLAEAVETLGLAADDLVLAIPADQPAFNPEHPALLASALREDPSLDMATLAFNLTDPEAIGSPALVKAAFGADHRAVYFSRASVPWPQDGEEEFYRHIGFYAYRAAFLRRFVSWPEGRLERIERLEILRALENGARIKVVLVNDLGPEVNLPGDVKAAEEVLRLEHN